MHACDICILRFLLRMRFDFKLTRRYCVCNFWTRTHGIHSWWGHSTCLKSASARLRQKLEIKTGCSWKFVHILRTTCDWSALFLKDVIVLFSNTNSLQCVKYTIKNTINEDSMNQYKCELHQTMILQVCGPVACNVFFGWKILCSFIHDFQFENETFKHIQNTQLTWWNALFSFGKINKFYRFERNKPSQWES